MTDPRLKTIAADAAGRGWDVEWIDNPDRTNLFVVPTVEGNPLQSDVFAIGFGIALGGKEIACWIVEGWAGSVIEPDIGWDLIPPDEETEVFQTVSCLEDALPLFDKAVATYLAWQRNPRLNPCWDKSALEEWADVQPLAGGTDD